MRAATPFLLVVAILITGCRRETSLCAKMKALANVDAAECQRTQDSIRANYGDKGLVAYEACYLHETSAYGATTCYAEAAATNGNVSLLKPQ